MTGDNEQKNMTQSSNAPALLPRNTDAALKEVIKTVQNLGNIYQKETSFLKDMNTDGFTSLLDQKVTAAKQYQNVMGQMLARKNEIATANPQLREKMKNVYAKFSEISQENLNTVERMHRCSERLSDTIRNAVIRSTQSQRSYSYSNSGAFTHSTRNKAVSSGLSETI